MKVVFFIVFIAYVQATSEPFFPLKELERNIHDCVKEHGLNKDHVLKIWDQSTLPEDDKDFSIFLDCVADGLHLYEPDGEVKFKNPYTEPILRKKLKLSDTVNLTPLIEEVMWHCKKFRKVEPRVVNAIRRRNCAVVYADYLLSLPLK